MREANKCLSYSSSSICFSGRGQHVDITIVRQTNDTRLVIRADLMMNRRQRQGAIHQARVQAQVIEATGQHHADRRFPRRGRAIDGDYVMKFDRQHGM